MSTKDARPATVTAKDAILSSPRGHRFRVLHLLLLLLRFVCAFFGTGYVHPDEYFQSIQPAFRDIFWPKRDDIKGFNAHSVGVYDENAHSKFSGALFDELDTVSDFDANFP